MKLNRTTLLIMLVCFVAPAFIQNLYNLYWFLAAEILNLKCVFNYSGYGTLRIASNSHLASLIMHEADLPLTWLLVWLGYRVSKKASLSGKERNMYTGMLLFYSAVFYFQYAVFQMMFNTPLQKSAESPRLYKEAMPIFGTLYNAEVFFAIIMYLTFFIIVYFSYKIIFRYRSDGWRIKFFTYGLSSCLAGNFLWYFLLGPFIYRDGFIN